MNVNITVFTGKLHRVPLIKQSAAETLGGLTASKNEMKETMRSSDSLLIMCNFSLKPGPTAEI